MFWPEAEVEVDEALVRELLAEQFPHLAEEDLRRAGEGFDNYLWRLGESHVVRLPRRELGVQPLRNELRWLARAAGGVSLATPLPLFAGSPGPRFAWPWMVASWVDGVGGDELDDDVLATSAVDLAAFLRELHRAAPSGAPRNPWRSVPLADRAAHLEGRLERLGADLDADGALALFRRGERAPRWSEPARWLHGDLHPANMVFRDGRLAGVVDWGDLCSGDPATDLAGALLTLPFDALETFFAAYGSCDEPTRERSIGWTVLFGVMMVDLGRSGRANFSKVGRRALENAARMGA